MKELLKSNPNIIINADIDGVLCGLILHNFLNCNIVGFSNSADMIWIDKTKIKSIYNGVYIDMYVPDSNVVSIDQHIIAINHIHADTIKTNPLKINPNLENERCFLPTTSYALKYPFGTIHYICALLESEGINIDFDLYNEVDTFLFGDLMLRADDAMTTTLNSKYMTNATLWWKWLIQKSGNGKFIKKLTEYLQKTPPQKVLSIKGNIANFFQGKRFQCTSPDGGYKNITDVDGHIMPNIKEYISYMSKSCGLNQFDISGNYTVVKGTARRISFTSDKENDLIYNQSIDGKTIFSYSFVRSAYKPANFSYTVIEK